MLEQVAKKLGYADRSGAWRGLRAALVSLAQPNAEEYRKIQNERDDYLYSSLRLRIKRGDPAAVHAAIAVQNHQAKLNGLDVKKLELTGKDGEPFLLTAEQGAAADRRR